MSCGSPYIFIMLYYYYCYYYYHYILLLQSLNYTYIDMLFANLRINLICFYSITHRVLHLCRNETLFKLEIKNVFYDIRSNYYCINWLQRIHFKKFIIPPFFLSPRSPSFLFLRNLIFFLINTKRIFICAFWISFRT